MTTEISNFFCRMANINLQKALKEGDSDALFAYLAEIDEITYDEAIHSDAGGDSDADDILPSRTAIVSRTSCKTNDTCSTIASSSGVSNNITDQSCIDFDSDDSVADPSYEPTSKKTQIFHEESSDSASEISEEETSANIQRSSSIPGYSWSKTDVLPNKYTNATFSEKFGPAINVDIQSPFAIFSKLFTQELLNKIVYETNL